MTNQEVFKQYGSENWVVEENLCYLLQEYVEELHNKGYIKESQSPINTVGFVKGFMKENTLCNIEFAEKSKMNSLAKREVAVIDLICKEVEK